MGGNIYHICAWISLIPCVAFANWTMPVHTNAQAWGSSITATGTVREHTQVVTQYTTNAPVTWTNFYWRFDEGATSNDYTETDGETYTNLIVDVGVPDRTNTMLLSGRDAAMWELYMAQIERAQVVGDAPTQPSFYWHTDYIANLQARKDWIEANAGNWVCTTNADTNGVFDAYFEANTNATTFPVWDATNLLAHVGAPANWLDYTPTWPVPRIATNTVTLIGTNDVVTNAFWFGNFYTNIIGSSGDVVTVVFTNDAIADGFSGYDYQEHDVARIAMDALVWSYDTFNLPYGYIDYGFVTNSMYEVLEVSKTDNTYPENDCYGYESNYNGSVNVVAEMVAITNGISVEEWPGNTFGFAYALVSYSSTNFSYGDAAGGYLGGTFDELHGSEYSTDGNDSSVDSVSITYSGYVDSSEIDSVTGLSASVEFYTYVKPSTSTNAVIAGTGFNKDYPTGADGSTKLYSADGCSHSVIHRETYTSEYASVSITNLYVYPFEYSGWRYSTNISYSGAPATNSLEISIAQNSTNTDQNASHSFSNTYLSATYTNESYSWGSDTTLDDISANSHFYLESYSLQLNKWQFNYLTTNSP